jgi:hypothetical protein
MESLLAAVETKGGNHFELKDLELALAILEEMMFPMREA